MLKKIIRLVLWVILLLLAIYSGSWVAVVAVIGLFMLKCVVKSLIPIVLAVGIVILLYATNLFNIVLPII
jgi:hypothetical protein